VFTSISKLILILFFASIYKTIKGEPLIKFNKLIS